jgi:uncharacterized protein (TIGR00297 family)
VIHPPPGLLEALYINLGAALLALGFGFVRASAVLPGVLLGTAIYLGAGRGGFGTLIAFFVVGSFLTRWGYARKARLGLAEARKGRRGASHAIANTGVAAGLAGAAWFGYVSGDWVRAAFTAALATAAFDTAGTEMGQLYGKRPFVLPTFRRVPVGTRGGISIEGTLAGAVAAGVVAGTAVAGGYLVPRLLPAVFVGALAGVVLESLLHRAGKWNHALLNFLNTLAGAAVAGALTFH